MGAFGVLMVLVGAVIGMFGADETKLIGWIVATVGVAVTIIGIILAYHKRNK